MRRFFVVCCLVGGALLVGKALYFLKGGFSPRKIQGIGLIVEEKMSEETLQALEKTYVYLGRGRQCFAFSSEDGKYVLKIPRTDIYKTPVWMKALVPTSFRKKVEEEHQHRKNFTWESFQIAFHELQEETGVLALHLQKRVSSKKLRLIDRSGYSFFIPLNNLPFILQKKQPMLIPELIKALEKGNLDHARTILRAFFQVIQERARKGILNRDRSFLKNYGFDGEKAYQIDLGSFFKSPQLGSERSFEKSVQDSIDPIIEWLSHNYILFLSDFN